MKRRWVEVQHLKFQSALIPLVQEQDCKTLLVQSRISCKWTASVENELNRSRASISALHLSSTCKVPSLPNSTAACSGVSCQPAVASYSAVLGLLLLLRSRLSTPFHNLFNTMEYTAELVQTKYTHHCCSSLQMENTYHFRQNTSSLHSIHSSLQKEYAPHCRQKTLITADRTHHHCRQNTLIIADRIYSSMQTDYTHHCRGKTE